MEEQEFLDENDPILNQIWAEIQRREIGEVVQFEENRTVISGLELMNLFFKPTRDEIKAAEIQASIVYADSPPPLLETIGRMERLVMDCIGDGVTSGNLKLVEGNLKQDFDTCQFPAKDAFLLIKQRNILPTLRDEDILIRPALLKILAPSVSPAQSGGEPDDIEDFVRSLTFYFSDPCIFVRAPNRRFTPHTLPSIGFRKPDGVTAQDFISILTNSSGPSYSLGPSHYFSGGRNMRDVSSDGTCEPQSNEDHEDGVKTGIHEEPQKIEISDYQKKKARLKDINKKLCQFIKKEFGLPLKSKFNLYELNPSKGAGEYKFKFQTQAIKAVKTDAFLGMEKSEILKELKILSCLDDEKDTKKLEENIGKYAALVQYAKKKDITDDEIDRHINLHRNWTQ